MHMSTEAAPVIQAGTPEVTALRLIAAEVRPARRNRLIRSRLPEHRTLENLMANRWPSGIKTRVGRII